ncbi:hypothetical protein MLD38_010574 [Melastoma candidum]|uniref:Uncharacterized protein n=1 Tax=Melastoma candidum TaxID=119954 RepID=A0ACB9QZP8_9MYRT|nr:hypothetical protein MLD38_010574 [Melastoma candidum]
MPGVFTKLGSCGLIHKLFLVSAVLGVFIYVATLSKISSLGSLNISNAFCNPFNNNIDIDFHGGVGADIRSTIDSMLQKIREEIDISTHHRKDASSQLSGSSLRYYNFLNEILKLMESVQASLVMDDVESNADEGVPPPANQSNSSDTPPADATGLFDQLAEMDNLSVEEIRKYVDIKPNRLGRQNFMGANGTFTSIGHACFSMRDDLEEYMDYNPGQICNDDWKLSHKLMAHGCDPLPRRRCFALAPQQYSRPYPINESMWKLPDDRNVRWSQYKCKNFDCLAAMETRRGFFKCADCFNLTSHESPRWITPVLVDPETNKTTDFMIAEVLAIKPGEIRIGLDFSIGTGSFAARMREHNVTIVSATVNLGAPFNEMIALRGLVPLYLTINHRLPFYDNTLDMIHTTRFLDGWIDLVLLEFTLYDWDRVLRPGGLLWIDSFFCIEEDVGEYQGAFRMLGYKEHKWVVIPKVDKDANEVFFSAVLEKPPRPDRR